MNYSLEAHIVQQLLLVNGTFSENTPMQWLYRLNVFACSGHHRLIKSKCCFHSS